MVVGAGVGAAVTADVGRPGFDVLYIAGTARSGSTVLAALLGAAPGVLAAGELTYLFRDVYLEERPCSCGATSGTCPLWRAVRERAGWTLNEARRLDRLTRRMDSHRNVPWLVGRRVFGESLCRYGAAAGRVFDALREVTRAHVVVDSSKYVARAMALAACPGIRLRILSLTRSPGGIIHSFLKPNAVEQRPSSVPFAAAYYVTVLAQLRVLSKVHPDPVLELSYEGLARDPVGALQTIEAWCGLDLSVPRELLARDDHFEIGHMVTANRVRKEGRIAFRPEGATSPLGAGRLTAGALEAWRRLLGFP